MVFGWKTMSLLLLLLVGGGAQSGDRDEEVGEEDEGEDSEARISCSSHISFQGSSLTCKLLPHPDQDQEDSIQTMSLCYSDWAEGRRTKCLEAVGDTVSSKDLDPVPKLNLTVHLKKGGDMSTAVDLMKIVRPRSPEVWNVTFNQELDELVVNYRIPYSKDFLKVNNQMFQVQISSSASNMTQNISSKNFLTINMEHLHKESQYKFRVRSIPDRYLQGSWSEWSPPYSYMTPTGKRNHQPSNDLQVYITVLVLVSIVVLIFFIFLLWKYKIFTYMWPQIPQPKQTLVPICRTNKGVYLCLKPEVFSSLRVSPLERREDMEPPTVPSSIPSILPSTVPSAPPLTLDSASLSTVPSATDTSSTLSSGCSSVDTETSTLLSSSCGEDSAPSTSPSYVLTLLPPSTMPSHILTPPPGDRWLGAGRQVEVLGQQEEAYVTMSSFYQTE